MIETRSPAMLILLNLLSEECARGHRSPFSRSFEVEAFPNNHQNGKGELAVGQLNGSGPVSFQIDGLEQLLYDHLAPQLEVEWDPVRGICSR